MKIKLDLKKYIIDTIHRGKGGLNWIFIQLDKSQNEKKNREWNEYWFCQKIIHWDYSFSSRMSISLEYMRPWVQLPAH